MTTDLTVKMDKDLAGDIDSLAASLDITRDEFIACVFLDWRARTDASREADGHAPRPMLEFVKPDDTEGTYRRLRLFYDQKVIMEQEHGLVVDALRVASGRSVTFGMNDTSKTRSEVR